MQNSDQVRWLRLCFTKQFNAILKVCREEPSLCTLSQEPALDNAVSVEAPIQS